MNLLVETGPPDVTVSVMAEGFKPNLLACLRAAGARVRPAEAREQSARPWRWKLFGPIRRFRPLTQFPLSRLRGKSFYVSGQPRPNSKNAAVVNELREAGIDHRFLAHGTAQDENALVKALRLIVRLPWAIGFVAQISKRCRSLDGVDRQTLLNYALARRWLRNRPGLMPIIISDVSPRLNALWAAAAAEGNRAIWWQDDFHHHWRLPYAVRGAAVLNEPGLLVAKDRGTAQVIAKRPTKPPLRIRPVPNNPIVGLATNASFYVGPTQIAILKTLATALNVPVLHLRVHPTRRLSNDDLQDVPVQLAPQDETMEEFASRIDLAVVGNSAAQLWLIRQGVPVIHVAGLDVQQYDLYGYVKRGFIYCVSNINELNVVQATAYYSYPEANYRKVFNYTSVSSSKSVGALKECLQIRACVHVAR